MDVPRLGPMMRTVAILNQKGGVGKTTVTLGLASAAAAAGRRVLVVDLDPQASSTWVLGLDPRLLHSSLADLVADKIRPGTAAGAIISSDWSDHIDVLPATNHLVTAFGGKPRRLRKALAQVEDRYEAVLI